MRVSSLTVVYCRVFTMLLGLAVIFYMFYSFFAILFLGNGKRPVFTTGGTVKIPYHSFWGSRDGKFHCPAWGRNRSFPIVLGRGRKGTFCGTRKIKIKSINSFGFLWF